MADGVSLNYNPSWRDRLAWAVSDLAGDNRDLRNYLNAKTRAVTDFIPVVGDAVGFNDAKRAFDRGNYGEAALDAATSAIGSIPGGGDLAAAAIKALPIGPMAKGWNRANHFKAMEMAIDEKPSGKIWQETGSVFLPDRRWRQEISDAGAKFRPDVEPDYDPDKGMFHAKLQDMLDHPEFFENYPDLGDIPVYAGAEDPSGTLGFYSPVEKLIQLNPDGIAKYAQSISADPDATIKGILLHELTHAIQGKEGFDPGFNPEVAELTLRKPQSFAAQTLDKVGREAWGLPKGELSYMDSQKLDDFKSIIPNQRRVAQEAYTRNVGETEARNVEKRSAYPKEYTARYSPLMTADRKPYEQLSSDDLLTGRYDQRGVPGMSLTTGPAVPTEILDDPKRLRRFKEMWTR